MQFLAAGGAAVGDFEEGAEETAFAAGRAAAGEAADGRAGGVAGRVCVDD